MQRGNEFRPVVSTLALEAKQFTEVVHSLEGERSDDYIKPKTAATDHQKPRLLEEKVL